MGKEDACLEGGVPGPAAPDSSPDFACVSITHVASCVSSRTRRAVQRLIWLIPGTSSLGRPFLPVDLASPSNSVLSWICPLGISLTLPVLLTSVLVSLPSVSYSEPGQPPTHLRTTSQAHSLPLPPKLCFLSCHSAPQHSPPLNAPRPAFNESPMALTLMLTLTLTLKPLSTPHPHPHPASSPPWAPSWSGRTALAEPTGSSGGWTSRMQTQQVQCLGGCSSLTSR